MIRGICLEKEKNKNDKINKEKEITKLTNEINSLSKIVEEYRI